jgi:hypothetical protein
MGIILLPLKKNLKLFAEVSIKAHARGHGTDRVCCNLCHLKWGCNFARAFTTIHLARCCGNKKITISGRCSVRDGCLLCWINSPSLNQYKPYLYHLTQCINTRNTLLSQITSQDYKNVTYRSNSKRNGLIIRA